MHTSKSLPLGITTSCFHNLLSLTSTTSYYHPAHCVQIVYISDWASQWSRCSYCKLIKLKMHADLQAKLQLEQEKRIMYATRNEALWI